MKKRNFVALFFIILAFVALLLWVASIVIDTANKIESLEIPYLIYVYYVASGALVLYFLVYPFFTVMFAPTFTFNSATRELKGVQKKKVVKKHYLGMVKFAKKLTKKTRINEENTELIKLELAKKDLPLVEKDESLQKLLVNVLNKDLKKDLKKIIIDCAKDTLYLTSISQNSLADVLIVVVNNFRMLKKIVRRCGFRPSFFRLLKFYCNVGISSLIADGAQNLDISSMLGGVAGSVAKPLVGSLINGSVNAFFMLRTGFLAANYIFMDSRDPNYKEEAINYALIEATTALPELTVASVINPVATAVNNTVINPTKKAIKKLFSKKENLLIEEELEKEAALEKIK